jgi:hypothetical protein
MERKTVLTRARNNRSKSSDGPTVLELVRTTITDFRSQLPDGGYDALDLMSLAAACMADAIWLFDGEFGREEVFNHCTWGACFDLKRRADRLQTDASAILARTAAIEPTVH